MARSRPLLALLAAVALFAGASAALPWPSFPSWESARLSRLPSLKAWAAKKDCKTVFNIIESRDDLGILTKAVNAADLDDTLDDPKAVLTVFAPTDDAFEALLERLNMDLDTLLSNKALLVRVLDYHVAPGAALKEEDLQDGQKIATMARMPPLIGPRENVTVRIGADESIIIDGLGSDARVIETDIVACASVVHVVDTVLLPDPLPGEKE